MTFSFSSFNSVLNHLLIGVYLMRYYLLNFLVIWAGVNLSASKSLSLLLSSFSGQYPKLFFRLDFLIFVFLPITPLTWLITFSLSYNFFFWVCFYIFQVPAVIDEQCLTVHYNKSICFYELLASFHLLNSRALPFSVLHYHLPLKRFYVLYFLHNFWACLFPPFMKAFLLKLCVLFVTSTREINLVQSTVQSCELLNCAHLLDAIGIFKMTLI